MRETNAISYEHAPLSRFHKKLWLGGIMGQFSDAYMIASVAIPMSLAMPEMGLSAAMAGLIGAAPLLGTTCGSMISGRLADYIGRRWLFSNVMSFALVFTLLQYVIATPAQFWLIRFFIGYCVGTDYAISLTMLNEWNPKKYRTLTLGVVMVGWSVGYVVSYFVSFGLISLGVGNWRLMLCTAAVPLLAAICLRVRSPETPKWLAAKKSMEQANKVIKKYIGNDYHIEANTPDTSAAYQKTGIFAGNCLRNTLVGGIFYACQCFPYYGITIFLPMILKAFDVSSPYLGGLIFNIFLLLGAPVGCWLTITISRRAFLAGSFYLCALFFLILFFFSTLNAALVLVCVSLFAFSIAAAMILETVYPPELFPTVTRGSGVGFCVACGSLGSISGTFLLPVILENYGLGAVTLTCFGVLLAGGIICQLFAPETFRGKE